MVVNCTMTYGYFIIVIVDICDVVVRHEMMVVVRVGRGEWVQIMMMVVDGVCNSKNGLPSRNTLGVCIWHIQRTAHLREAYSLIIW